MDALSELLDTESFRIISSKIDAKSTKNCKYILNSLKKHPQAANIPLENVTLDATMEEIHYNILFLLGDNHKLISLFSRLWSYFFPLYNQTKRRVRATLSAKSLNCSQTRETPPPVDLPSKVAVKKTLYDFVLSPLDMKSIQLLSKLENSILKDQCSTQMQYILKSLKNHSDSNILFYYKGKDSMNLLDVVERFYQNAYTVQDTLRLDIQSVFDKFITEFPLDGHSLKRAQAHFEYLWTFFFPNLSSRTRMARKKTL